MFPHPALQALVAQARTDDMLAAAELQRRAAELRPARRPDGPGQFAWVRILRRFRDDSGPLCERSLDQV
jgi:hypothetical protein